MSDGGEKDLEAGFYEEPFKHFDALGEAVVMLMFSRGGFRQRSVTRRWSGLG